MKTFLGESLRYHIFINVTVGSVYGMWPPRKSSWRHYPMVEKNLRVTKERKKR